MSEIIGNWLHFSGGQRKRKRAELVCVACHSKKVKCDLQTRHRQGHHKCSNCDAPDRECHLRPSKRAKQRPGTNTGADTGKDASEPAASLARDTALPRPGASMADLIDPALNQPFHPSPASVPSVNGHHITPPSLHDAPRQHHSSASPADAVARSHAGDVDTGFLELYGPENTLDAEQQEFEAVLDSKRRFSHPQQQELLQSFAETYWEYCHAWCPVLDRDTLEADLARSPLLANALALAASHVRPPLLPHEGPATYYDRARNIFYGDEEADGLVILRALALFYWWAPRPPSTAHRHSSWWWTSVIIRHAQQMNIHREPSGEHAVVAGMNVSLRRRIWWTAFARERLTALCQSKPCIIDPEDCNVQECQLADFPPDTASQRKGLVFIYWVRLCGIIGRIAKHLSRSSNTAQPFPADLQQALTDWAHSLPAELQLPIGSQRTESFDRDVHQLHLPYLTTIIILHLKRSAHDLPKALPPAILAASCIARVLRDILSRGDVRFLMAITCWYSGTAFVPLLQASRIDRFAQEAEEGLNVLTQTVAQLQTMWGTARIISQAFDRLRKSVDAASKGPKPDGAAQLVPVEMPADDLDWAALFPFATRSTSRIAEGLLRDKEEGTATGGFPFQEDALFHETLLGQYNDLLDPSGLLDFSDMTFET